MSVEDNKARVKHCLQYFTNDTLEQYLDLYDEHVVLHGYSPGLPPGRAGARLHYTNLLSSFPDPLVTIGQMIGEGDLVACVYTLHGC